jgi:acetyl-CoA carboxylase carboxyl transferase subunit beta
VIEEIGTVSDKIDGTGCQCEGLGIARELLDENLLVCQRCGYHHRLRARERLQVLVDSDSFEELSGGIEPKDSLGFVDVKPYSQRLREAQHSTGEREAALFGTARIDGLPVAIAVMDFFFIAGTMGAGVGEIVTRAIETAIKRRLPLLIVSASGGARVQEGALSLMQMAKISIALAKLADAGLPYLVILTDPTYGGVSASFASLGDILIAEPRARIGFAGRSVIEDTIRKSLPDHVQSSEFLLQHGMIDMIVPRDRHRALVGELLWYYERTRHGGRQSGEALPVEQSEEWAEPIEEGRDPWKVVMASRNGKRPTTEDYISRIFEQFHPLSGDRLFGDDRAILGGLARLCGVACMAIRTLRGGSPVQHRERNYGMPHPEGYRKALRLMQHAAKVHFPVVTFIDTIGAFPGDLAEERGQSHAIARNLLEMALLPVPIIAVITGQGGSGGALALALADRVLMLESAYYSVITPEACSIILFKDQSAGDRMARSLKLTAHELKRIGVIDEVLPEPPGGAHTDFAAVGSTVRKAVIRNLRELLRKDPRELVEDRHARFRRFGVGPVDPEFAPEATTLQEQTSLVYLSTP